VGLVPLQSKSSFIISPNIFNFVFIFYVQQKLELCEIIENTISVEKGQYTVLVLNNCLLVDNVLASCFEVFCQFANSKIFFGFWLNFLVFPYIPTKLPLFLSLIFFQVNHTLELIDSLPLQALYHIMPSMLLNKTFTSLVKSYDAKVDAVLMRVLPYARAWKEMLL
jgi:hypothetical protein